MWLAGGAFVWRFHDTDMYLTWQLIGNMPNELAEKATAIAVVAVNVLTVALGWYFIHGSGRALRFVAHASLVGYVVAILLPILPFKNVTLLCLLVLPLLLFPVLAFFVGRRPSVT